MTELESLWQQAKHSERNREQASEIDAGREAG